MQRFAIDLLLATLFPPTSGSYRQAHRSVAQLEAVLLLRRESDVDWDAASTAGRLYIPPQEASDLLSHSNLIAIFDKNRFSCKRNT